MGFTVKRVLRRRVLKRGSKKGVSRRCLELEVRPTCLWGKITGTNYFADVSRKIIWTRLVGKNWKDALQLVPVRRFNFPVVGGVQLTFGFSAKISRHSRSREICSRITFLCNNDVICSGN